MIVEIGKVTKSVYKKDGGDLPVVFLPIIVDEEVVTTVEVWADIRQHMDGTYWITIGTASETPKPIPEEKLSSFGFRMGMKQKSVN